MKNKVPLIAITIFSRDIYHLEKEMEFLEIIKNDFDLIEIRGDYFIEPFIDLYKKSGNSVLEEENLWKKLSLYIYNETIKFVSIIKEKFGSKEIIFTLRSKLEGGYFEGSLELYFKILNQIIPLEIDWLDIEYQKIKEFGYKNNDFMYMNKIHKKSKVIISYHNLKDYLSEKEIIFLYNCMEKYSPNIIKIVSRSYSNEDIYPLLYASLELINRATPYSLMNMGNLGYISRYLSLYLGNNLVFSKGFKSSAVGQVSPTKLRLFFKTFIDKSKN